MKTGNGFYVYAHKAKDGRIFYIGKGTGDRAWARERHLVWQKFVANLGGEYTVEILHKDLSEDEALEIESGLIDQLGKTLVNWINTGRDFHYDNLKKYHELRDANRIFIQETRAIEATNLNEAAERYKKALQAMREYESLTLEQGLVAELMTGEKAGDLGILDRLTLCLDKLGRHHELIDVTAAYFQEFPGAMKRASVNKILTRIERAKKRCN